MGSSIFYWMCCFSKRPTFRGFLSYHPNLIIIDRSKSTEIRTIQKEAVISYIDRFGHQTPRAGAPPETSPPPPPPPAANGHHQNGVAAHHHQQHHQGSPRRQAVASRGTAIPIVAAASGAALRSNSSSGSAAARSRYGAPAGPSQAPGANLGFTVRREAEKQNFHDAHIHHLRQTIESRLKVRV